MRIHCLIQRALKTTADFKGHLIRDLLSAAEMFASATVKRGGRWQRMLCGGLLKLKSWSMKWSVLTQV